MTKKIGIKNPKPGRKIRQNRTFLLPGQFFCHFWSRYKNIYDNHNFCHNCLPENFFFEKNKNDKKNRVRKFQKKFFFKKKQRFLKFSISIFFVIFGFFAKKNFFMANNFI